MRTIVGAIIAAAWLASPAPASAQTDRWSPWVGCWALTTENVHEGRGAARAAALSPVDEEQAQAPTDSVPRTCVVRSGDGVRITTTVPDQPPVTQTIVADGSPHDLTDGDCHGVEHTEWSANGTRLLARAEVTCLGALPRTLTGMGLITRNGEWLDIRSFRIDDRDATRVSRYRRVAGVAMPGAPLTVGEITEAAMKVSPSVVEAAVAETRPRLTVNKKLLLDLADAQVPTNVIDVMIAVAYPERFVIDKPIAQGPSGGGAYVPVDPFWPGYYYPAYYYSPFAYGYLGQYDPWYGGGIYPGAGYPIGGGGGGGDGRPPASGVARAINGQGYTRIHPAEGAEARPVNTRPTIDGAAANTPSSAGTSSSSSSSSSSPAPAPSSDSGSSGGGASASPQGFSGGGGTDTGRTAVPR